MLSAVLHFVVILLVAKLMGIYDATVVLYIVRKVIDSVFNDLWM